MKNRPITRAQAEDMSQAHAEGHHTELPREGCPDCEDRPLSSYPRTAYSAEQYKQDKAARERRS